MDVHGGPGLCSNMTKDNISKYVCNRVRFGRNLTSLLRYKRKTKIMASGPITSWEIDGETVETVAALFLGAPKSLQMVTAAMKLKDACSLEEKL